MLIGVSVARSRMSWTTTPVVPHSSAARVIWTSPVRAPDGLAFKGQPRHVRWLEAEHLAVEGQLGLERRDDVLGLAEAVPLARKEQIRVRDPLAHQGIAEHLGLRRWHHLV